jgi:hypothetical protein
MLSPVKLHANLTSTLIDTTRDDSTSGNEPLSLRHRIDLHQQQAQSCGRI